MLSVSDKLLVFRSLISCAVPIPYTEYDARTFQDLSSSAKDPSILYFLFSMDADDNIWQTPNGANFESLRTDGGFRPIVCTNSVGMAWISEIETAEQLPYRIHTIGPVFVSDYSIQSVTESLAKHSLSDAVRRNMTEFIRSIPVVSTIRFYEYGLMLHWCLTGEHIAISDLTYLETSQKQASRAQEPQQKLHGTYLAEQRMLRSVREGNLQFKKEMDHLASAGYTGHHVAGRDIRYLKNYVIIYTALCCRAAVQGGLDVETAYTLSDQYLESIEAADSISSLHELSNAMVRDYIERVHRAKASGTLSPQIRTACEWIALEPQAYGIHTLAEKLGYTDYYFSKLFRKETGKTVNEYILAQKMEAAKSLLRSGNLPVAEIADRLGIESQSYFTSCFRKATGMTPSAYRKSAPAPR